jgi:hypothetical protein
MSKSNGFAIKSNSAVLLGAFIKEAEKLGVEYINKFTELSEKELERRTTESDLGRECLYFSHSGFSTGSKNRPMMSLSCSSDTDYRLPNDWDKAIERVKEFVIAIAEINDQKRYTKFNDLLVGKTYMFYSVDMTWHKKAHCYSDSWSYITPVDLGTEIAYILSNTTNLLSSRESDFILVPKEHLYRVGIQDENFKFKFKYDVNFRFKEVK